MLKENNKQRHTIPINLYFLVKIEFFEWWIFFFEQYDFYALVCGFSVMVIFCRGISTAFTQYHQGWENCLNFPFIFSIQYNFAPHSFESKMLVLQRVCRDSWTMIVLLLAHQTGGLDEAAAPMLAPMMIIVNTSITATTAWTKQQEIRYNSSRTLLWANNSIAVKKMDVYSVNLTHFFLCVLLVIPCSFFFINQITNVK